MKTLNLAFLFCLFSVQASAMPPNERVSVAIRLVGDDGLSLKFGEALDRAVARDDILRNSKDDVSAQLSIESDENVRWDELSGRVVIIYTIFFGSGRSDPIAGVCWENDIAKCARDIVRLARIKAQDEFVRKPHN